MASTTSLFTGLSGLNVHARRLDTISNNIANVNTTAFKSSRMLFENLFARTFSSGSAPNATRGGTNPFQVGLGVGVAATQRDFTPGTFNPTGDPRDLAIDGNGFFIVEQDGSRFYTRAGAFRQDLNDNLVTASGETLLGYGVDDNFNVITGVLSPVNIPLGNSVIAEQSSLAVIAGNLNAAGDLPGTGSALAIGSSISAGFVDTLGAIITAGTLLTAIEDPALPGSGTPAFAAGQSIQTSGISKGGTQLDTATLDVTAATTVQDLMDFLVAAIGIHDTGSPNPDGSTPGVTLDALTGIINIVGNTGEANDLEIGSADLRVLDALGVQIGSPFVSSKSVEADGEGVRTALVVYDSLGNEVTVDVTMVLEDKTNSGTTWRYYVESADDTDVDLRVATGTVRFDTMGQLVDTTPISLTVDRANTGATAPLAFELAFQGDTGNTTALADAPSQIANVFRDGLPPGTLQTFGVQSDGTIFGGFSNGAIRTLGRVAVANFANPGGLVDAGNNNWTSGPNSGPASDVNPGTFGTGGIVSGALEASNVDLSQEFTDLILVQTGYSASARVIRTADELMQQLLVIGR